MVDCTSKVDLKTLLIISGGIEAVPGIKLAKKMGFHVVVSDGNLQAPGFKYGHDKIIASTYNIDDTLQKVKKYHETRREINGVMCIASDVPLTVAKISSELRLPGIPVSSAKLAMDKLAMKIKFKNDNIPIPNFRKISSKEQFKEIIQEWGFPIVIKPVDNRGARGVLRITKEVDLEWAWEHSKKNSPSGTVMVEEFLDGPQISTESMMIDGRCYTVGFSDRNYEFLERYSPFIIENGGDLPSLLDSKIKTLLNDIVEHAGKSMGIYNGIIKGDIVIHDGKPYVIELAARLSGGYFCTHTIPMNTGVDLVNAIKMAIGDKIDTRDLIPKNKHICQRFIFPKPGIIKKINGVDELKNPTIKYHSIHIKPGDTIEIPTSHPSRAGMVIAEGNSNEEARKFTTDAINSLSFIYQ